MRNPKAILITIFTVILLIPAASLALDFGGPIEADLTWSVPDSPVHLTGDVRVSEGATLTIEFGVEVHSLMGRQVATLVNGHVGEGHHEVIWRGKDDSGLEVASGTYFYRLEVGGHSETKRMGFIK